MNANIKIGIGIIGMISLISNLWFIGEAFLIKNFQNINYFLFFNTGNGLLLGLGLVIPIIMIVFFGLPGFFEK